MDKCHPLTSAPRAVWQNWSLSPVSGADPKENTSGRAVSSFLVSTKGRLNLQVIAEQDLHRECFVPRAKVHLLPASPISSLICTPQPIATFMYLLEGSSHSVISLCEGGCMEECVPRENGYAFGSLAKLYPAPCCFATRDWYL